MGIKRLNKFLTEKGLITIHNSINDFVLSNKSNGFRVFNTRNKSFKIAVDTMLYAHKFKYSCNNMMDGFLNQIIGFLKNRIIPIYIIDGFSPFEKKEIVRSRIKKNDKLIKELNDNIEILNLEPNNIDLQHKINKLKKSSVKITNNDINMLIELLNLFHIPYIRANGEADALIGLMYQNKIIDACMSEDMDILVFGCDKMIKFKKKKVYEYNFNYILDNLNINKDQFLNMCILFGCDYVKTLLRKSPSEIYEMIQNINIQDILNKYSTSDYLVDFQNARNVFLNAKNNEDNSFQTFKINENINNDKLVLYLNNNNVSYKTNLIVDIIYINNQINKLKFI